LVEVPFWWDRTVESLAATIHKVKPDLIVKPPGAEPIPLVSPSLLKDTLLSVSLSHGYPWDGYQDVTGWQVVSIMTVIFDRWMSEKMDGVRAYWDGAKLLSRLGNTISCPQWFTSTLPATPTLDGELWMGEGTSHENVLKIMKSKDGDWTQVGYHIFDSPSSPGSYEERMNVIETLGSILAPHIKVVKNTRCTGTVHLMEYLNSIVSAKGEGVMLRDPQSPYITDLTTTLLKVKVQIWENASHCYRNLRIQK